MPAMDTSILTVALRRRQLDLWRKIVKEFEVEQSLNAQVQTWIREGTVSEKAYDRARRRR
jgi:hypothetical protein